ncbi:hypothetical protein PABG_01029 [Paracoccidioides brasiliensis Pb03]|nr:hypothetical protein PABG_01029 [Paracoccidioides brasiliensis Pb03]
MPAVNVLGPSPLTLHADPPCLKAHKALPRKRDFPRHGLISTPPSSNLRQDATPSSNGYAYSPAPTLPLTPPGLPLLPHKKVNNVISREGSHELIPDTTGTATPTHQFTPPTPDITPPRALSSFKKREGLTPIQPSMSSRAESFTTAREALSSDEDVAERRNAAVPLLLRPTIPKLPHPLRTNTSFWEPDLQRNVGPTKDGHECVDQTDATAFDSFEGEWVKPHENNMIRPRENKHKRPPILADHDPFSQNSNHPCDLHATTKSSWSRERSLKERLQNPRRTPITSVEKVAADLEWVSGDGHLEMTDRVRTWRLSGISTSSTVEAMVIDSPPRKHPTLRHSEKHSSLRSARSASSPIPKSNFDDSASSLADHCHRLNRKSARITNENRWSVSSDMSFAASVVSVRPKLKQDVVPVVVIPQRRSSLKSTNSTSRSHSRTRSLGFTLRPTTAPGSGIRSFDIFQRQRRTLSASLPSTNYTSGPNIPQRKSSLSAPTSRSNSRAPSLTLESSRRHAAVPVIQPLAPESPTKRLNKPTTPKITIPEPVNKITSLSPHVFEQPGDEHGPIASPSLYLTPFQPSIQSLSPGPVEIHEARAVPVFFHNNKSLLLVDQQPAVTESRAVQYLRTSPGDLEMKATRPQTPEMPFQATTSDFYSSLRNPRSPPRPPAVKFIPPTPIGEIGLTLVPERTNSDSNNGRVRRLNSVRRAFGSWRRTEAYPVTFPSQHVRNTKAGTNIDSKLHPFWLPQPFWEGFADSDCELEGGAASSSPLARGNDDLIVSNSLGIPQKRVTLAGPLTIIRRISNRTRSRRAARRMNNSNQELASHFKSTFPAHQVHSSTRHNHHYTMSRAGLLHISVSSVRGLQEWIARARRQRTQDKLEERREKLRQKIGGRVLPANAARIVPDGR